MITSLLEFSAQQLQTAKRAGFQLEWIKFASFP
jgi:hypothetical protein